MARPDSLRVIGFKKHLDSTRAKHNGLGYNTFCVLYDAGVNSTNLARAMNVSPETMTRIWLPVFLEQRVVKSNHNKETAK